MSNRTANGEELHVTLIASQDALETFTDNVSSLWCPSTIPVVELQGFSALEFCRDFVGRSRPCILRDTCSTTLVPPLPQWTVDDVKQLCGNDVEITVNVTPDGHGDAIRTIALRNTTTDTPESAGLNGANSKNGNVECLQQAFVLPEERRMSIASFVDALRAGRSVERQALTLDMEDFDTDCNALDHRLSTQFDNEGRQILHGVMLPSVDAHRVIMLDCASPSCSPSNDANSVFYYSLQNDCLRSEFAALMTPLQATAESSLLKWAEQAFGTGPPDAVNIWIGDERAHSSLHKDHYENLFYVASGEKIFTLYPPSDAAFLPIVNMPTSRFAYDKDGNNCCRGWTIVEEYQNDDEHRDVAIVDANCHIARGRVRTTPWIHPSHGSFTEHYHPITVRVRAGDILYLPSLWFHAVSQSQETVAVNWWFDMQFQSPLYCYFQLLENSRLVYSQSDDLSHQSSKEHNFMNA